MIAADKLISFLDSQDEVSNAAIQPILLSWCKCLFNRRSKIKAEHELPKS